MSMVFFPPRKQSEKITVANSNTNDSYSISLENSSYSNCQFLEQPCSCCNSTISSGKMVSNSSFTYTDNSDSSISSYQHSDSQTKGSFNCSDDQVPAVHTVPKHLSMISIKTTSKPRRKGCKGHTRLCVMITFCLFVLGAIAAFICMPRTPLVSMSGIAESLSGPPEWTSPPSMRATWQINVTLDNRNNWVPTHLTKLDFDMIDSLTLVKFAWATTAPIVLAPGSITPISLVIHVSYQAADVTNPTFQNLYNACGPLSETKKEKPSLNVLLKVYFHIFGILWTPLVTATPYIGGVLCPSN
ncbi:hypothetical protein BD560DRAFT_492166 [Blakeslea trispora]|nr:hypothetical protein BD560DRAFT_492166 [Blakeslea trispora]